MNPKNNSDSSGKQEFIYDNDLIPLMTLSENLFEKLTLDNIESPIVDLSEIPVHLPPTSEELSDINNWIASTNHPSENFSGKSQYLCHVNDQITPLVDLQISLPLNLPECLQYLNCHIDKELPSLPDDKI
jgi:hypothetical protein